MADNWDDEDREEVARPVSPITYIPPSKQFDDEEDGGEDDILDDWENDSDVEREKAVKAQAVKDAEERARVAAAEAQANKLSRAERIKQNIANNGQLKLAEQEAAASVVDDYVDPVEIRRREKESDLAHADDLFGDLSGPAKPKAAAKKVTIVALPANSGTESLDLSTLPVFLPKTKAAFTELHSVLSPILAATSSKKDYSAFVQDFVRDLAKPLTSDQVRKIVSTLTALSNEKMKDEKGPAKKSKAAKTKVSLNGGRGNPTGATAKIQDEGFDEGDGDDDYFM